MKVGIAREIRPGERRVAATPDTTRRLVKLGFEVCIESGAGGGASFPDADYQTAGAKIVDRAELWSASEIVLKVHPPEMDAASQKHEADLLREGAVLISFLWPAKNQELVERLRARKVTAFAMDQVPRITRAQKMDALSSMSNIAGYRAVIEAASYYGRFFTGQITAAGRVPPAKVLIIGAGVAGLSAIGAARSLGAIVRAFDTRPEVREQVHSMGAEFLTVDIEEDGSGVGGYAKEMSPAFIAAEMALLAQQCLEVDIVITTALIPGKVAPQLVTQEMVNSMRPGSVIVDLAAEAGGNCAVTKPDEVVVHNGVTVIGFVDLPSRLAPTASQLYGTNLLHLLADMGGGLNFHIDQENPIVRGAIVVHDGALLWPPPRPAPAAKPGVAPAKISAPATHGVPAVPNKKLQTAVMLGAFLILALVGAVAPRELVSHLTVFVLACFVGWQVVWNVTPALHTPLMSVTNAISGIILVGGMLQISGPLSSPVTILSAVAVLLATINIAGGFMVTQRMLRMFQK
ncbi:MAG: Re/Si-specific NAD(P)(+) transhydrogenase subunit alpha [Chthoniobacter sp.]|uniref:Re/Si-specific NAD(P)(+) transhydrogenase subunit alpha n=1 Tax=Chthoniobacter sp. TaxID=2510640 RepID=UPI0032A2CC54